MSIAIDVFYLKAYEKSISPISSKSYEKDEFQSSLKQYSVVFSEIICYLLCDILVTVVLKASIC